MNGKSAIIVGAGLAGIAAAIRLRNSGFEVSVMESSDTPGGKVTELRIDGFRFDAGPSLFTLPENVIALFELCGKNVQDYFKFVKLENSGKYFFSDGKTITAFSDHEKFLEEIEQNSKDSRETISAFLKKSETIYNITNPFFLQKSLHKLKTYWQRYIFSSLIGLRKISAFRTMHEVNAKVFKDKNLVQLFDRYATYNGSNPYKAPATLNVIAHLEHNLGAYLPMNGMYDITTSLTKLAEEIGVVFHFNCNVKKILTNSENSKVTSIDYLNKEGELINLKGDVVLSNMDIVPTYRKLLPQVREPRKILQQERSSSALIFYWGVDKVFKEIEVHSIFFSSNYQAEFEAIEKGTVYNDPTIYIYNSSSLIKKDAPEGKSNWFVMINVPANIGQNWDEIIAESRVNIISKLSKNLKTPIAELIGVEEILDPRLIEQKTSSFQGALYGNSSNNKFSAFLRHANFSSKVKSLYFCGGSVHPGGGIPLVLLSAKIVSEIIVDDFTKSYKNSQ